SNEKLSMVFALNPELGAQLAQSQQAKAQEAGDRKRAAEALSAAGMTEQAQAVMSGVLSLDDASNLLQQSWSPKAPLEINGQLVDPTTHDVLGDYRSAEKP